MDKSDPDLWSLCIAGSPSVTFFFLFFFFPMITASPFSKISDDFSALSQENNWHKEREEEEILHYDWKCGSAIYS